MSEPFRKTIDRIADLLKRAVGEAIMGKPPSLYLVIGDQEGPTASAGLFNTACLGDMLNRLCIDAERSHTYGDCAHCDAVADAIKQAQQAFIQSMEGSRTTTCTVTLQ